eukprot:8797410-Pyramimonas_sp.AAC.1
MHSRRCQFSCAICSILHESEISVDVRGRPRVGDPRAAASCACSVSKPRHLARLSWKKGA